MPQDVASAVAESDSDADDVSKKLPTPRHKKQKTSTASGSTSTETHGTKKVRGKRGLLNKLTEMPLDILLEILGNLEPLDLLHINLPPCPDDMAEPAYASLLFERFCHSCGSPAGNTIEWISRTRLCFPCIDKEYVDDKTLEAEGLKEVRTLVPSILLSGRRRQECRRVYHHETAVSISKTISEMSKKEKETWVEARKELIDDRDTEGDECMMWLIERAQERSIEGEQIRIRRRDTIVQRLKDLGWADEIERMPDPTELTGHPLVWQRKDLTDRSKRTVFLQSLWKKKKAERLEWQESAMLHLRRPLLRILRRQYAKTLPPNSIVPPEADLNDYEPFRNIIEETPPDQEVTVDDFNDVLDSLPEFVSQWREEKDRELLRIMGAPVEYGDSAHHYVIMII
ncbi:hypothetical protein BDQ17DRAFT_1544416 [Cyathus striatus]|nr:hypothetical protein BDQ17DRAFT_1544416 [Cyathus striatus]